MDQFYLKAFSDNHSNMETQDTEILTIPLTPNSSQVIFCDSPDQMNCSYKFNKQILDFGTDISNKMLTEIFYEPKNTPTEKLNTQEINSADSDIEIDYDIIRGSSKRQAYRIKKGNCLIGVETVLSVEEENQLVDWIKMRYECGYPVKKIDLITRVSEIIGCDERVKRFKDGKPGEKWFMQFLKRNPGVVSLGEAERSNKDKDIPSKHRIRNWVKRFKDYMNKIPKVQKSYSKEKNFGTIENVSLPLINRKTKVSNNEVFESILPNQISGNIEVVIGASADGLLFPPMPIFACYAPPSELINSIPNGWGIGLSKDGNINKEVLLSYFKNILIPWLEEKNKLPFLLFIDELKQFISLETADLCAQNNLVIYNLPPNSKELLQPLYLSVLHQLEKEWLSCNVYETEKEALLSFCPTFNKLLYNLCTPESISNSFRSCGFCEGSFNYYDDKFNFVKSKNSPKKTFSNQDYSLALEILEETLGEECTNLFHEARRGNALLKPEDKTSYSIWFEIACKIDLSARLSQNSEYFENYRHSIILKGNFRPLSYPEMYLIVQNKNSFIDNATISSEKCTYSKTLCPIENESSNIDNAEQIFVIQNEHAKNVLFDFTKSVNTGNDNFHINSSITAKKDQSNSNEEEYLNISQKSSNSLASNQICVTENPITSLSSNKNVVNYILNKSSSSPPKSSENATTYIFNEPASSMSKNNENTTKPKNQPKRKIGIIEKDLNFRRKLKSILSSSEFFCSVCLRQEEKLLKCIVCDNCIHFNCMKEQEQEIVSLLMIENSDFDYVCPNCSHKSCLF